MPHNPHSTAHRRPDRTARGKGLDLVGRYLTEIGAVPLLTAAEEVQLAKRIEAGLHAEALLSRTATAPQPAARSKGEFEAVAADGRQARNQMIRANLRLVVAIVRRWGRRDLSFLDAVQEGNLGLIRAVDKFDYTKGFKFSTYATWWIRQALGRGNANHGRTIRIPVHAAEELVKARRADADLRLRLNRRPTADEVARATGISATRIAELCRIAQDPISLDVLLGERDNLSAAELFEDIESPPVPEVAERHALAKDVHAMVATLPAREAQVIALRYGLDDGQPRTLREVADDLDLTKEGVRKIEKQALDQLRRPTPTNRLLAWAG